MRSITLSLEIHSKNVRLTELESMLSIKGDYGSFCVGDKARSSGANKTTRLKKFFEVGDDLLSGTLEAVASSLLPDFHKCTVATNSSLVLSIAVFHSTANCSLRLSPLDLKPYVDRGADVKICTYPCE
jgi:hypothetical protein